LTPIIEILISPQGETTINTKGFQGLACRDASRFLEQALGQTLKETLTAEFHQSVETQATQEQQRPS
jgi:hypothetical protein